LKELDISWNNLATSHFDSFLEALKDNRKLHFLNLSWNNIAAEKLNTNALMGLMNPADLNDN